MGNPYFEALFSLGTLSRQEDRITERLAAIEQEREAIRVARVEAVSVLRPLCDRLEDGEVLVKDNVALYRDIDGVLVRAKRVDYCDLELRNPKEEAKPDEPDLSEYPLLITCNRGGSVFVKGTGHSVQAVVNRVINGQAFSMITSQIGLSEAEIRECLRYHAENTPIALAAGSVS